ncbi:hypothetical protein GCM10022393_20340 [Aquimarina addita]|uniref:Restriction endonuclease n=1 Tax=Aquimarina addita TaxID=870485 RepID=A0ABP6UMD0_9FLAO
MLAQLPQSLLQTAKDVPLFDGYQGSIYKTLGYRDASLIDEKSGSFDAPLRYNIYSDLIEHQKGNEQFAIVRNKTTHARIDGEYFYYCDFKNQRGSDVPGYFVLIELHDDYRIYKKYSIDVKKPQQRSTPSGTDTPGKLATKITYFLEENSVIMELPLDKKGILGVLSDKETELKEYIKKEKIKVRKEEDLIRLVSRYNALKRSESGPSGSLLSSNGSRN